VNIDRTQDHDPARLREWLLGRLPEQEAEILEIELLDQKDLFEKMRAAEADLFDDLAAGRMDASDRDAFLARRRAPGDRARLTFARALAQRAAEPNVVRPSRFVRNSFLAAAAVLVIALTALLTRPGSETRLPADSVAEIPLPTERVSPPEPNSSPVPTAVLRTIEVTIFLGTTRSEGAGTTIELPEDAGVAALRIELDPYDVYDSYRVRLRGPDGALLLERTDLGAIATREGRHVAVSVPAEILHEGSWELAVAGLSDGEADDLGFETIAIRTPDDPKHGRAPRP
jgi:hypothetical protein